MRSRGLVVALALLLAILATAGVFLYVRAIKKDAVSGGSLVTVVVANANISANTPLNPLLDQGVFKPQQIPSDAVVEGAVTNPEQLRNRTATSAILAGEQIPLSRISGTGEAIPGGQLGLRAGYQAVTVALDAEQFVGANIQIGDHISFYAHFDTGVSVDTLRSIGFAQVANLNDATSPTGNLIQKVVANVDAVGGPNGVTVMVVPETRVLGASGAPTTSTTSSSQQQDSSVSAGDVRLVTLELKPEDVERLIFAQNEGKVWFGLIRPGDTPPAVPPLDFFGLAAKHAKG